MYIFEIDMIEDIGRNDGKLNIASGLSFFIIQFR